MDNTNARQTMNSNSKLREAVESLLDLLDDMGVTEEIILIADKNRCHKESLHTDKALEVLRKAKDALAEPPRNCDVGTAEEQEERYFKLKKEYIDRVTYCPAVGQSWFPDSLYWAQMEYEGEAEQ